MKYLAAILMLFAPFSAEAAIAFVNAGHNAAYSTSFSFTATGCTAAFLFIAIDGPDAVSAATYAGSSATQLVKKQGATANQWQYIYGILNPTTGANDWSVTSSDVDLYLSSTCYSDVGYILDATASNFTASQASPYSASITTVCDNAWSVFFVRTSAQTQTASTNSTERTFEFGTIKTYDSGGAITPAGAFSQSITYSGSDDVASVQASFCISAPAVAASPSILGLVRSFWIW